MTGDARHLRRRAGRCATRSSARRDRHGGRARGSRRPRPSCATRATTAGAGRGDRRAHARRSCGSPANVHGSEESGADAVAARRCTSWRTATDCAARQILDNAIVVILPTQNPDGREADTRRNAYGFDMNRDWFARTQPETDGKLELLRQLPAACCSSTRTRWAARSYFFPPNADPIYHEIAGRSRSTGSTTSTARRCSDEFDAPAASRTSTTRRLRPVLHGLRRHRARDRLRRRRHDVREGRRRPRRRSGSTSST